MATLKEGNVMETAHNLKHNALQHPTVNTLIRPKLRSLTCKKAARSSWMVPNRNAHSNTTQWLITGGQGPPLRIFYKLFICSRVLIVFI